MSPKKWISTALVLTCLSPVVAMAQAESATSLKASDVIDPRDSTNIEDVDQILTNNQMRAATGSKSKWSIATGLSYQGGKLSSPFAAERPNLADATGTTPNTLIDGSISGKYSINVPSALLFGVGVRWLVPFQGAEMPKSGDKVDADNPYLNYQYIYRWRGVESVVTLASTYFTASDLLKQGYLMSLGLSQNSIYKIPRTRVSVGTMAYTGLGFYTKNDFADEQGQSDYSFGFLPFVEYQITDRLNFHSGWNLWIFEHIRAQHDPNTYNWDKVTQNLGVGISITRDFFLYPNIQFLPDNMRADRTTVALSSNLNIF